MRKKWMAALLAAGIFVGALAGCGGGASSSSAAASSAAASGSVAASSASQAAPAGEVTELSVWLPATAEDGNDEELWKEIVAPFEEANNVVVNFQFISWKDYEAKFTSGIATGTGPDVGRLYVEMFPTIIDAGAVEDLTGYLTDEDYSTYTVLTERNQIFGKPYGIALSGTTTSTCIFYNQDILDAIGEKAPETWDDVRRIAEKATLDTDGDGTIDQYGLSQGWGQTFYQDLNWNWYSFVWQAGGDMFDETGKCIIDQPEGVAAAQLLYDLKNTYNALPEDAMSLTNAEAFTNYFLEGKAAMAFSTCGSGNFEMLDAAGFNYGFSIQLKGDNGDQGNWSPADQLCLFSASENKELAMDLIRYVTGPEGGPKLHEMDKSAPCTNAGEPYFGNERTKEVMEEFGETCTRPLTAARRAPEVYDYTWKTLQEMLNGGLSPEEAMSKIATFANEMDYADPNA